MDLLCLSVVERLPVPIPVQLRVSNLVLIECFEALVEPPQKDKVVLIKVVDHGLSGHLIHLYALLSLPEDLCNMPQEVYPFFFSHDDFALCRKLQKITSTKHHWRMDA